MGDDSGRTPTLDIFVGSVMIVLSVTCGTAYCYILKQIAGDREMRRMASYRLMFLLGIFEVIQCVPHALTGVFTLCQSVWHPLLAKALGVLATPAYVGFAATTIILSFNRFIMMLSPATERRLFGGERVFYWFGLSVVCWFLFAASLSSPYASIVYHPQWYSWDYDHEFSFSKYVQRTEMIVEVGGILISGVLYILVVILLRRMRTRFQSTSNYKAEMRILIQAFVITAYCTALNFFWHNSALLPPTLATYTCLNIMWIFNAGVHPLVYFIIHRKKCSSEGRTGMVTTVTTVKRDAVTMGKMRDVSEPVKEAVHKPSVFKKQNKVVFVT